jgi:hypothetical protein
MARVLTLLCALTALAVPSAAVAQTPTEPASGAQVTTSEVVLRWTLQPGHSTTCIEWAYRPETSFSGGPFLERVGNTCVLDSRAVAHLLGELEVARYYWHVQTEHRDCTEVANDDPQCEYVTAYGPTVFLDSVAPPGPPMPKGCTNRAAEIFGQDVLLPHAESEYPSYFAGIEGWGAGKAICRDLSGDGDKEMIVRMSCCTGGSLSPWAIFKHNSAGEWRMAYAQVRDTVFQLKVKGRTVKTMLPAPYEGACTRFVRYRNVSWSGSRFRSKLTRRSRLRGHC